MTEREASIWLAGLLDGEGCFGAYKTNGPTIGRATLRVSLEMTDKDLIDRASEFSAGAITSTRERKQEWKRQYCAFWCGLPAEILMKRVLPFMGERRTAKIHECLAQNLSHHPKKEIN